MNANQEMIDENADAYTSYTYADVTYFKNRLCWG